jgi:hypothetical protein
VSRETSATVRRASTVHWSVNQCCQDGSVVRTSSDGARAPAQAARATARRAGVAAVLASRRIILAF